MTNPAHNPTKPVAIITGGHQGIGLGVARALAANFTLALVGRSAADAEPVQQAMAELTAIGAAVHYLQHDIADVAAHDGLVRRIGTECGQIATLISNAGVAPKVRGDLLEMTPNAWDFLLDINLRGTFFLAQAVARHMVANNTAEHYRSLVFITSVSATHASINRGEYCISKAGASMMANLFALRLAPHNIGVFEVQPGTIETAMTANAKVREAYDARIKDGLVPNGRWGVPADVGAAVVPMTQGAMAYATGSIVQVDGGLSIARI